MSAAATTVRCLRVHAPAADSADARRTRRAVQQWLAHLTPAHYGLPAQAIVVVRQVKTPLPALVPGSPWPDPLAALLRGAARPALQPAVGAAVAAVWFSDEAELLACLARDTLAARDAWWWPLLPGCRAEPAGAAARWCQAPTQLPRALRQMATAQATAWLQAIGAGARRDLLQALGTAYPLCDAVPAWVAAGDQGPRDLPSAARPDADTTAASAPVPPASAALRLRRLLCALADDALAAATAEPLAAWGLAAGSVPGARGDAAPRAASDTGPSVAAAHGTAAAVRRTKGGTPRPSATAARGNTPGGHDGQEAHDVGRPFGPSAAMNGAPAAHGFERPATHGADCHGWPKVADGHGRPTVAAGWRRDRAVPARLRPADAAAPLAAIEPELALDTRFGGLFFVLNAALALGLYGDFTQPRSAGLAHSPWQLLWALGRRWGGRGFSADPLSRLLRLRAAERDWPRCAAAWTLPALALRALADDARPWHAVVAHGALQLWHPGGFVLARWPMAGDPAATAAQALQALGAAGHALHWHGHWQAPSPHGSGSAGPAPPRPDLLADLAPCLARRLGLALGLPRPQAAVKLTLRLHARVSARPGRFELHFELASLPLALRLAGLDRDPGWVPAAGCDFRLHFH
ncbi:MAG: hypothetical protein C0505_04035 [Leptothrix sp. (in: Bacteria)]|nr:hypothetical protein [Leptothrix sp. (in: b-proteobacteria)]